MCCGHFYHAQFNEDHFAAELERIPYCNELDKLHSQSVHLPKQLLCSVEKITHASKKAMSIPFDVHNGEGGWVAIIFCMYATLSSQSPLNN
jgi:hypothetical protein